jgi:hypothetical protein
MLAAPVILGGCRFGHLLSRGHSGIEARDAWGKSLGLFRTLDAAVEILKRQEIEA